MLLTLHKALDQDGLEMQKLEITTNDDRTTDYIVKPFTDNPEDAIIGRGLLSATQLMRYMEIAYEAGKNGEHFIKAECMNSNLEEW